MKKRRKKEEERRMKGHIDRSKMKKREEEN